MKRNLIIVGTSETAERIYGFVRMYELYNIIGFAVDKEYIQAQEFMGLPIYELEKIEDVVKEKDALLFVAIFWNNLNSDRRHLYERLKARKLEFANIISPTAVIRGKINGDNNWINDYVIIQSGVEIESDVFIMDTAIVGNQAKVLSHSFVAVSSIIGGASVIGEQCFVGINAVVFDSATVGNKCIIGACTAIKRNVPDNTVCKVSTDNVICKSYDDDMIESKLRTHNNIR